MTKVLLFTNKEDITIDFVVRELQRQAVPYYRFNTEELFKTVHLALDFVNDRFLLKDSILGDTHNLKSFTAIYYRRPELPDYSDSDIPEGDRAFLRTEAYYTLEGIYKLLKDKYWINDVYKIREAENKIFQLSLGKKLGFILPETMITSVPNSFRTFIQQHNADCIIKPIHNGRIMDSAHPRIVYTSTVSETHSDVEISCAANYLQANVHKESDIRVTLIQDKVFAVSIDSQSNSQTKTDWRKSENVLPHRVIELPDDLVINCQTMMKELGLVYGAFDFIRTDDNKYVFLELNPNGQWAWIEKVTGLKISETIVKALCLE